MTTVFKIYQGQRLILKQGKEMSHKPQMVEVLTKDCDNEWLISLKDVDNKFILPKSSIFKFYEPAKNGRQSELFGKPETRIDKLKKKHLRNE